jgi:hypothetical protein
MISVLLAIRETIRDFGIDEMSSLNEQAQWIASIAIANG